MDTLLFEELRNRTYNLKMIEFRKQSLIDKYKTYHTATLSNQQQDIENDSSDATLREHEIRLRIYSEILRDLRNLGQ